MKNITIENISKTYENGFTAVKNINIQINKGEFAVLVGPSGCGKSTILRMIAGLEDITEGNLLFDEQQMNQVEAKNRDIGMVFQNYALYPHLSVFDNLAFPLKINKVKKSEIKQKVEQVAEILELSSNLDKKPKHLSGGQRQRVALGRAIIKQPNIFLFDEPLSNLDAKLRTQMRTEIIKLHRNSQATSIYVTHDQTEAMTMADRIILLNAGEVVQIGTPQELYHNPVNLFAASFLGSPQINLFSVQAKDGLFQFSNGTKINISNMPKNTATLGIRPEDISINEAEYDIVAKIENIEYMGFEKLIYFDFDGLKSIRIANTDSDNYHINQELKLKLNSNILFFDEIGERIYL